MNKYEYKAYCFFYYYYLSQIYSDQGIKKHTAQHRHLLDIKILTEIDIIIMNIKHSVFFKLITEL